MGNLFETFVIEFPESWKNKGKKQGKCARRMICSEG